MVSLRVRKASTLACSRWLARVSFSSSPCSCACWAWRSVSCCWSPDRRVSASRARSSRPDLERLLRLLGQLVGLQVELVGLELDPLAAGGDVGDSPAHLLQQLELPLVGVVERLPRVLELVQGLVGLGAKDQGHALKDAHELWLVLPVTSAQLLRRAVRPRPCHATSRRPDYARVETVTQPITGSSFVLGRPPERIPGFTDRSPDVRRLPSPVERDDLRRGHRGTVPP